MLTVAWRQKTLSDVPVQNSRPSKLSVAPIENAPGFTVGDPIFWERGSVGTGFPARISDQATSSLFLVFQEGLLNRGCTSCLLTSALCVSFAHRPRHDLYA